MKKLLCCASAAALLALGLTAPVQADMCTIDNVPAATLLLPYFEVSPVQGAVTTLFSLNNASATAALAHITLWTDWSLPTVDFDVYLTGYDVVTVNLYDLIWLGNIPITADDLSRTRPTPSAPRGRSRRTSPSRAAATSSRSSSTR